MTPCRPPRRIACPVLLLLGSEDRMTPPAKAKALAEAIPGAMTRCSRASAT